MRSLPAASWPPCRRALRQCGARKLVDTHCTSWSQSLETRSERYTAARDLIPCLSTGGSRSTVEHAAYSAG